jgi:tetratricopeptide (TPR) repeat protein
LKKLVVLIVAICLSVVSCACYNDNDTYLTELRDNLDITNAIIGRFTLYPESYYKKRIEIQKTILKKDPNNLDAYDNISVAYDRIGDGENALKWITEKRKHLTNAPKLHLYSTEANEGTFLIVRWIRGHKKGDLKDAIEAEKHIAKALEINPDAHFGREFSQLYCIRAMIMAGKDTDDWEKYFTQDLLVIADKDHIDRKKLRYGIAGMMVLGAAWNAPVFIQAIAELVPDEPQIAELCKTKVGLLANGNKAIVEKYPIVPSTELHEADYEVISELISNGEEYQTSQKEWILNQVVNGKHTDLGHDMWKGYKEVPQIPNNRLVTPFFQRPATQIKVWTLASGGFCILVPTLVTWWALVAYRRRRKLRQEFNLPDPKDHSV